MNKLKNENGAALIITLMIITLFLTFVMTQFYQLSNTMKQITTIEKSIDAQLVAEMGVDYYRSIINNYNSELPIMENVKDMPKNMKVKLDTDRYYQITQQNIEETDASIIIAYTSTGVAFTNKETIDDKITINLK